MARSTGGSANGEKPPIRMRAAAIPPNATNARPANRAPSAASTSPVQSAGDDPAAAATLERATAGAREARELLRQSC